MEDRHPLNTRPSNNADPMLGQRRRSRTSIAPALFQCLVFASRMAEHLLQQVCCVVQRLTDCSQRLNTFTGADPGIERRIVTIVGFTLIVVGDFRRLFSQFSTSFHEILPTLFTIHVLNTLKVLQSFDKLDHDM